MIKRFFKWLFKSDYGSDLPSPWDGTDYLNCDKTETEYIAEAGGRGDAVAMQLLANEILDARIEEQELDKEFWDAVDPKGCRVEIYKDRKKEWRWRMLAANNKIIATSGEGYKRRGAMRKSLKLVTEVMAFAPVEEK